VTAYLDTINVDDGDDYDHGPDVRDSVHHIYLGPPVLRWSAVDTATEDFRQTAYSVIKQWIVWEETNLHLRPYKLYSVPRWNTNEPPTMSSGRFGGKLTPSLIEAFAPGFAGAMMALERDLTTSEAAEILRFIDFLRRKGISGSDIDLAEWIIQRTKCGVRDEAIPLPSQSEGIIE
jgi:hypothetical protein